MNYQELSRLALTQQWAARLKADTDVNNAELLRRRQTWLDSREGIGVGDFVVDGEKTLRVAYHWGDSVQLTDGRFGASFYLGDGYVSFSGGLEPGIPVERFEATNERRAGAAWFFSEDRPQGHNGYHTEATFRVWKLRTIRLQVVTGTPFITNCARCNRKIVAGDSKPPVHADLNGPAFKAYYCADCTAKLGAPPA